MDYKGQRQKQGNQERGCPGQRHRWLQTSQDSSPQQKPPPRFYAPIPKSIPGGAKQTEGEGGVSQLLQQLGERCVCQCLEDSSPLP